MALHIVILAAGQGKRMFSKTPKVLHTLGGKAFLARVIEAAAALNPDQIHVIIGHEGEKIKQALSHLEVNWVNQDKQLGTGHAVLQALPHIPAQSQVLILSADVPLITPDTLRQLTSELNFIPEKKGIVLLTATMPNVTGLGRIIRDDQQQVLAIIEEKDASNTQKKIREAYSGICTLHASVLKRWLPELKSNNAQNEYYLTEIISLAAHQGTPILALQTTDYTEVLGINNRIQQQELERIFQSRLAQKLMSSGVALADASRIDIRGELHCEQDVFIDVNVVFKGIVHIGEGTHIAPNCILNNVTIGKNCEIFANSILEDCHIEAHCQIGPFARIRPGTTLAQHCKIGNFVETKNARFGQGSKASHLSYLGDVSLGENVNIGAGTITCNYDGANKHQTIIENGVFIGSDTQLVAPVVVGENATIGAGSTIRKNVPAGELTLTDARQKTVYGWKRPTKK